MPTYDSNGDISSGFEDDHRYRIGSFSQNNFNSISNQNNLTTGELQNKIKKLRAEIKIRLDMIDLLIDQWANSVESDNLTKENKEYLYEEN